MKRADAIACTDNRLDSSRVIFVYTMFHHLGDFVVMTSLLRKFDLLSVEFESIIAHQNSAYVPLFNGKTEGRFFNVATVGGLFGLIKRLRREKTRRQNYFRTSHGAWLDPGLLFFLVFEEIGRINLYR